jgi:AcrR family transcriptional regulator
VSHNAAYRHFEDLDGLLAAVCGQCMDRLADRMLAELAALPPADDADAARTRLRAIGRVYVEFALDEPGWFRTAFGAPANQSPGLGDRPGCYEILGQVLDEMVAAGAMSAAERPRAEYPAWSTVHGIATLLLDGPLRRLPPSERSEAIDRVLDAGTSAATHGAVATADPSLS